MLPLPKGRVVTERECRATQTQPITKNTSGSETQGLKDENVQTTSLNNTRNCNLCDEKEWSHEPSASNAIRGRFTRNQYGTTRRVQTYTVMIPEARSAEDVREANTGRNVEYSLRSTDTRKAKVDRATNLLKESRFADLGRNKTVL